MAACDLLLMPSRYEPCGLPQMYRGTLGTIFCLSFFPLSCGFKRVFYIFPSCGFKRLIIQEYFFTEGFEKGPPRYSQMYGTLPIVHATGGLVDSVNW